MKSVYSDSRAAAGRYAKAAVIVFFMIELDPAARRLLPVLDIQDRPGGQATMALHIFRIAEHFHWMRWSLVYHINFMSCYLLLRYPKK